MTTNATDQRAILVRKLLDDRLPEVQLELKDRALAVAAEGVTIADVTLPDAPLIYANAGFERLTGYSVDEVLGKNCRFLQGPETDDEAIEEIRQAIREQRECLVEILNYRKDGSTFWNRLSITPVKDSAGELTHFIGVQSDVTKRRMAEERLRKANRTLQEVNDRIVGDLEAAARIQQSLLPIDLPDVEGFHFAWDFRPCDELAGDTLNIIRLDDGRLGFFIIDVSGHGVRSALLSVTLSHTLSPIKSRSVLFSRSQSSGDGFEPAPPGIIASQLNRQFQMDPKRTQFFTMMYGILDCRSRTLRYVSAGHPPAVYLPATGEARLLPAQGLPVGLVENAEYAEDQITLEPGDRVFLYTDGIIEAVPGEHSIDEFGVERLIAVIEGRRNETLETCVKSVREAAESWCGTAEPNDDLSVLALEVIPE